MFKLCELYKWFTLEIGALLSSNWRMLVKQVITPTDSDGDLVSNTIPRMSV